MPIAYELGFGSFKAGTHQYLTGFQFISISNTYGKNISCTVKYRVTGDKVDLEASTKTEQKTNPMRSFDVEFIITGTHKTQSNIGYFMTKIMGYLNNLTYLIENSDFTGSLRIPQNANEAKSVRYVRKIF